MRKAGPIAMVQAVVVPAAATLLLLAGPGASLAFPTKPVELTVLFGAGSGADLLARKLAELAERELGPPVTVVNRTGAGGAVGYTHVKGQGPDGYAIVWNSNSISTAYHAGNMPFDHTAFAGVAQLTTEPVALAV
jgi:tripartite-type tricarboxylate transporter receptor subunit TctC